MSSRSIPESSAYTPMKQENSSAYIFNDRYQEKALLKDGAEVILRPVIPADRLLLAHGMDNFSPESRYQRFLGARADLSASDLRYLTEIDGVDHFALGALVWPDEGVGVARFVRFVHEPEIAEPAIAVIDSYQNKGLGRLLFSRLIAAARERGIQRFCGSMLSGNKPMNSLLHSVGSRICFEHQGPVVKFEMDIDQGSPLVPEFKTRAPGDIPEPGSRSKR